VAAMMPVRTKSSGTARLPLTTCLVGAFATTSSDLNRSSPAIARFNTVRRAWSSSARTAALSAAGLSVDRGLRRKACKYEDYPASTSLQWHLLLRPEPREADKTA
jgi:hypothetical protein